MNKEWQDKLTNIGASMDSEGNVSFGNDTSVPGIRVDGQVIADVPLLVDLSHLAVVDITGADTKTFLQDQFCNDVTALSEHDVQINGYCSPKGRLLALFTVFAHEDGYRLLLPDNVAEAFTKRLSMFIMFNKEDGKRAQVTISTRTDLICSGLVYGAAGDPAAGIPTTIPDLPEAELQISKNQQLQIMRWHDAPMVSLPEEMSQSAQQRYLCIAEQDTMIKLWHNDAFSHASSSYWRWADINAGIPGVYASSTEQFIPQMLNMHLINALSFKHGCYPGQEIVARMQYLGKLKKHTKHLRVSGATHAPKPGEVLTTESNNNAGQVVDAVVDQAGLNLLVVVNIDTDINALKLGDFGLVDAPLPYSLEPEENQAS